MYTFEDYLETVHHRFHPVLHVLRAFVLESDPEMKEAIKWKVPTYSCQGLVCYFSVSKGRLYVGFMQGHRLRPHPLLAGLDLKMVRHVYLGTDPDALPYEGIAELLEEAIGLNKG